MRALIDVSFVDNTSYSDNNTNDVVGMVLPHSWGPVGRIVTCDYSNFLSLYPQEATKEYAVADSCFNAGAGSMEIFRLQGSTTYFHVFLYLSKASENDDLEAEDFKSAYLDVADTQLDDFDACLATVVEGNRAALTKLKTLYDAIVALEAALSTEHSIELEAFKSALEAAKGADVQSAIPDDTEDSDWDSVAAEGVDKPAISEYFQSLVLAVSTVVFTPAGTAAIKLGKDRQTTVNYTKPVIGGDDIDQVLVDFVTGCPGNIPLEGDLSIRVNVGMDEEENQIITFTLIQNLDGDVVSVESMSGSPIAGTTLDGRSYYIAEVVRRDSDYFDAVVKVNSSAFLKACPAGTEFQSDVVYDVEEIAEIEETDIVAAYTQHFGSCALSNATILIPCRTTTAINNAVKSAAGTRMDCCAIIGYPIENSFTLEEIQSFARTMLGEKFAFFYAGRDVYTLLGQEFNTSCVGVIAGRYCQTTEDATINQLPSAQAYGSYPGTLVESLDETGVLALHEEGFNSVYQTATGPYIWGLKSLHSRQNSYFAKANVMRVIAQLLATTFDYLETVLHTPNSDRKKAMVQQNRQAFLDQLIAQDVLRGSSTCQCDRNNNQDKDTNGGELLIVDFDMWFVKLIERFHIRIKASDDTTTVEGV